MDLSAFMYSVIGGATVAVINHFLAQRHQLLMKRELYREILYREKVTAYREVYALGFAFLVEMEKIDVFKDPMTEWAEAIRAEIAFRETIKKRGLLMPDKVVSALRSFEKKVVGLIGRPAEAARRFKPGAQLLQEQAYLLAAEEKYKVLLDILKQDLGVETLTKDLGEFFRTASFQVDQKPLWKIIFEKVRRHHKTAQKPSDTK